MRHKERAAATRVSPLKMLLGRGAPLRTTFVSRFILWQGIASVRSLHVRCETSNVDSEEPYCRATT